MVRASSKPARVSEKSRKMWCMTNPEAHSWRNPSREPHGQFRIVPPLEEQLTLQVQFHADRQKTLGGLEGVIDAFDLDGPAVPGGIEDRPRLVAQRLDRLGAIAARAWLHNWAKAISVGAPAPSSSHSTNRRPSSENCLTLLSMIPFP
jgi:hypothetical protein